MPDAESPLSPVERLLLVSLYTRLTVSRNRTVPGLLAVESPCCADLNISSPRILSHKGIPAIRLTRGIETC